MERQTLQQQTPIFHVCQQCAGTGCSACSDLCIVEGDLTPINGVIGIRSIRSSHALFGSCPFCGEHMEGNGHSLVLYCPNTTIDIDLFEPDASPVYCYQDDDVPSPDISERDLDDTGGPYRAGDDDENTTCQYCGESGFHAEDCLYAQAQSSIKSGPSQ